jgi:hypothetical protein
MDVDIKTSDRGEIAYEVFGEPVLRNSVTLSTLVFVI